MGRLTNSGKEIPGFGLLSRLGLHEGYHRDTNSDVISLLCTLGLGMSQFLGVPLESWLFSFFLSFFPLFFAKWPEQGVGFRRGQWGSCS